jgi:hypothetical protein
LTYIKSYYTYSITIYFFKTSILAPFTYTVYILVYIYI